MQVRRAVVGDAAALGRLQVEVWRATYAGLMAPDFLADLDPDRLGSHWAVTVTHPCEGLEVAVGCAPDAPDRIVGFGAGGPPREEHPAAPRELYALNVTVSAQGSGLADALLSAVAPSGQCELWVVRGNGRAMSFYRKHGFAPDGHEQTQSRLGVVEERWVRRVGSR